MKRPKKVYRETVVALKKLFPKEFPEERFYRPSSKRASAYKLTISEWPQPFADDFRYYMKWSTDAYAKGRPKKLKQKPETATNKLWKMERYVGFLVRVQKMSVSDVSWETILDYENILDFLEFLSGQNKPNGFYQKGFLKFFKILAAYFLPIGLKKECEDAEAILEILQDYVATPSSRPDDFADRFDEVVMIADAIRDHRLRLEAKNRKGKKTSEKNRALLYEQELIIRLALRRPFRSRNFREMAIGKNLLIKNGKYIIRFDSGEHKAGDSLGCVEFPVPDSLIPMLEEFLTSIRPVLASDSKNTNLFLTTNGTPFCKEGLRNFVSFWSREVHGKPLAFHHLRHIAATCYLKENPGDYLTVQKMLMHKRLETTIRIYSQYTERHAAKHYDAFGDEAERKVHAMLHATPNKKKGNKAAERTSSVAMLLVQNAM